MTIQTKEWDEKRFCKGPSINKVVSIHFLTHSDGQSKIASFITCNNYQCKQFDCCYNSNKREPCTKEYINISQ